MTVMPVWCQIYLFAFLAGAVSTLFDTPVFGRIARKFDFMDRPQANHKGHGRATPLLGGAAMFTGWLFCLAAGLAAAFFVQLPGFSEAVSAHLAGINSTLPQLGFLVLGAFLAVLIGLVDDKYAL